ncbi:hypothetical protein BS78_08G071400 [Paspalum vaginatum]|nr:hypothetical protein BS78_08G071400 [Paspalum vaginatum]
MTPSGTTSGTTVCADSADDLPTARYAVWDPCWVIVSSPYLAPRRLRYRDITDS